jgi:hypothetical protein
MSSGPISKAFAAAPLWAGRGSGEKYSRSLASTCSSSSAARWFLTRLAD